jgi:hypothetical protein
MTAIDTRRTCADLEGEMVVFLIGMRVNRPWKVHKWWPITVAMTRMLKELYAHPELGFVHAESWFGRTNIMVQYWRSFEALEAYAKSRDHAHLPAWAAFNRAVGSSGDVGIWHETYRVRPGDVETLYHNMPPFGLARATGVVPATGRRETAAARMKGSET